MFDNSALTPGGHLRAADESSGSGPAAAWNANNHAEPQTGRLRVVIVDDHKLIADTMVEILVNAGFDARAAYEGRRALELISAFHPDCILSDVLMPDMNGVELAIAVRKSRPDATILLFSGQAGIAGLLEDAQHQGYEFELIAKPIHPLKLIERLKEL